MNDRVFTVDSRVLVGDRRACTSTCRPVRGTSPASNVPPAFVITQRINLGLTAVLGRLRARP